MNSIARLGSGSNIHKGAWEEDPPTAKQIEYIEDLFIGAGLQATRKEWLQEQFGPSVDVTGKLTKGQASKTIARLRKIKTDLNKLKAEKL